MQALYSMEVGGEDATKALNDILAREKRDSDIDEFIVELFHTSLKNRDWCENEIKSRLNNWEFKRVAILDRLLLVLAISEIFFIENIPPKVSIAEAIEIANDTPYGLTNYIQTQDKEKVKRVARKLRSGMVDVNGAGIAVDAPFGGFKHSGIG